MKKFKFQGCKFFGSAKIGAKGQFVVPVEARDELGLQEGDKLLILSTPDGNGILAVKPELLEQFIDQAADFKEILKTHKG